MLRRARSDNALAGDKGFGLPLFALLRSMATCFDHSTSGDSSGLRGRLAGILVIACCFPSRLNFRKDRATVTMGRRISSRRELPSSRERLKDRSPVVLWWMGKRL